MLGLINLSIKDFVVESFGANVWEEIIAKLHINTFWISSCPYEDKQTTE